MGFDLTPELMANARFNDNALGPRFSEFIRNLETNGYPVVSTFRPHPSVTSMSYAYSGYRDKDMGTPLCGDGIVNMYHAYENSYVSGVPEIGPNVTDMENAFAARLEWNDTTSSYDCYPDIAEGKSGPNVTIMDNAYEGCIHLTSAEVGDKVTNMYCAYQGCNNLTSAACGSNVKNMDRAYSGCTNIVTAACGPNVVNMEGTYRSCYNLTTAVCGPNVVNMAGAYTACSNLKYAACGRKVTDEGFESAFSGCFNLEVAACGDSITNLNNYYNAIMHPEFINLTTAACGNNVTDMRGAYAGCTNLKFAACGDKVTDAGFIDAYKGCVNLTDAVCGNSITNLNNYYNAKMHPEFINLTTAACGNNVTDMRGAYDGCTNLLIAACGDKVTDAGFIDAYKGCVNLIGAACGNSITNLNNYYNAKMHPEFINLEVSACGENVTDMCGAYDGCTNLNLAWCGHNVVNICNTFNGCINLDTIVVPTEAMLNYGNNLVNAFSGFDKLKNIYFIIKPGEITNKDTGPNLDTFYDIFGDIDASNLFISSACLYNLCGWTTNVDDPRHETKFMQTINFENLRLSKYTENITSAFRCLPNIYSAYNTPFVHYMNTAYSNCPNLEVAIIPRYATAVTISPTDEPDTLPWETDSMRPSDFDFSDEIISPRQNYSVDPNPVTSGVPNPKPKRTTFIYGMSNAYRNSLNIKKIISFSPNFRSLGSLTSSVWFSDNESTSTMRYPAPFSDQENLRYWGSIKFEYIDLDAMKKK